MMKRLMCAVLAVALLMGVALMAPPAAKAASQMKISEDCLNLIKVFEGFSATPYRDTDRQYTIGYGTRCPDDMVEHYMQTPMTKEEAEQELRKEMANYERDTNKFIDRHGVTFTQSQFDAVVSLVFNCGTSWLTKGETLIKALSSGATGNDLIHAFTIYSMAGGTRSVGHIKRRLSEAYMYLEGGYARTAPSTYGYVLFNANGGTLTSDSYNVQGYSTELTASIYAKATYAGRTFSGWYTSATGGQRVEVLDASTNTKTLYAHWEKIEQTPTEPSVPETTAPKPTEPKPTEPKPTEPKPTEPKPTEPKPTEPKPTEPKPTEPKPTEPKPTVPKPTEPKPTEPKPTEPKPTEPKPTEPKPTEPKPTEPKPTEPKPTEPKPTEPMPTEPEPTEPEVEIPEGTPIAPMQVVVNSTMLSVCRDPGLTNTILATVNRGDILTITATYDNNGYLWGACELGWVGLSNTNYEAVLRAEEEAEKETQPQPEETPVEPQETITKLYGTIKTNTLNVRISPEGVLSGMVYGGDKLEILEQMAINGRLWGRISRGWICLEAYVALENVTKTLDGAVVPDNSADSNGDCCTVVKASALIVRDTPGGSVVGKLSMGDKVELLERKTVDGRLWGRCKVGWIRLGTYAETENKQEEPQEHTDVTLNKTYATLTDSVAYYTTLGGDVAGSLEKGERIEILDEKQIDGFLWSRCEQGWLLLGKAAQVETVEETIKADNQETATVIATCLNLRAAVGMESSIVDMLYQGTKVQILETKRINGAMWARLNHGWISMDYITQ